MGVKAVVTSVVGAALLAMGAGPAQADSVRQSEWHLDAMESSAAWKYSTGLGITVAVIDSGVDKNLPDLRGQVLNGKDFSSKPGNEYNDLGNHGTEIAALIAGTGRYGGWGLAPGAKILPIRFPYVEERVAQGSKTFAQDMSAAIRYAADSKAKVINISVGDANGNGPELDSAVKYALDKGKLLFAAVGNSGEGQNRPEFPAATPGVVGVGGLDRKANQLPLSNTGPQVDISAPAQDITSPCPSSTNGCVGSGTSSATALTSASAALLWSKHPDWTNNQILRVLLNTASGPITGPRHNEQIGYGAVRPLVALKNPGNPGPADVYPLPDLAASEKKSGDPSASASASAGAPAAGGSDSGKQSHSPAATAASDSGSGGSTGLWIGIGAAVVVVVAAAAAFAVSRVRRKARAAGAPPQQPPYAYTTAPQPYYPPQDQGYPQQQPPQYPGQYPPPPSGGQSGPPAGGA
ncbi:type VII secretion-associated serine protease mycosin [Streptomyces sp. DW26H14]|uniref:type VII secretion-associated serine protease mycosin n=1 Tax=Streptomyces sp. DW26H14 TaxID=3435395 RepID=UPI00403DC117